MHSAPGGDLQTLRKGRLFRAGHGCIPTQMKSHGKIIPLSSSEELTRMVDVIVVPTVGEAILERGVT